MTLTRNLFFLFAVTVFAIASTVLTVFNYNPFLSAPTIILGFYVSLAFSIAGIISLCLYFTKIKATKNESVYRFFWPSVRQAWFVSLAVTVLLYLQSVKILDWLIGLSVVIIAVLLELFFESKKPNKSIIKKEPKDEQRQPSSN